MQNYFYNCVHICHIFTDSGFVPEMAVWYYICMTKFPHPFDVPHVPITCFHTFTKGILIRSESFSKYRFHWH